MAAGLPHDHPLKILAMPADLLHDDVRYDEERDVPPDRCLPARASGPPPLFDLCEPAAEPLDLPVQPVRDPFLPLIETEYEIPGAFRRIRT